MHHVRSIFAFIKSTPAIANGIGIASLAVWVIKALFFDAIPAPFPQLAALGSVMDGVLAAIFAGYIFYILFALLPEYRDKKIIAPYIYNNIRWIVGDCMGVLDEVKRVTGLDIDINTVENDAVVVFSAVRVNTPPNMVTFNGAAVVQASWFDFLEYRRQRTLKSIAKLVAQNRFLEVGLISLLTGIEGCNYFNLIEACLGRSLNNPNLSFMAPSFGQYLVQCRALARWHDDNIIDGQNRLIVDQR